MGIFQMKSLKELNLTNNYLFCLVFLAIAAITSLLIPITNEVWDDISGFIMIISILTGIVTLLLSANLFSKNKLWHKAMSVIFILITLLFEYFGIKEFIALFS